MNDSFGSGRSAIKRNDNEVIRPTGPWSPSIHKYLKYLNAQGLKDCPYPNYIDEQKREHLSYVEGVVHCSMEDEAGRSDELLVSLAVYLKKFHEMGSDYLAQLTGYEAWMLPAREPCETMCHGDLGPYNIVTESDQVIGLIDFDTLHPGPVLWDLAYALYRWVPLMSGDNPEDFGGIDDKLRRIELFMQAYDRADIALELILNCVINRVEVLTVYMLEQAKKQNHEFQKAIDRGDLVLYHNDIIFISKLRDIVIIT